VEQYNATMEHCDTAVEYCDRTVENVTP